MFLASCATTKPPPHQAPTPIRPAPIEKVTPVPPSPEQAVPRAATAPLTALGAPNNLPGWQADMADSGTLAQALRRSCGPLSRRTDQSGLTEPGDWQALCAALVPGVDVKAIMESELVAIQVGDGQGLNTGYYEPQLYGALTSDSRFHVPLYRRPPELIDVDLGQFRPTLEGQRIAGQLRPQTKPTRLIPYHDRAAIEEGALAHRDLELVWLDDPWEAFFLQVQGSGQIILPDGQIIRIGYDGQNGHPYTGIGKLLKDRGILGNGQHNLSGILAWAHANPQDAKLLFRENKSYVFFRRIEGDGPVGALGVALTPERSLAVDPLFVPLGAPVWLSTRTPDPNGGQTTNPLSRLFFAQDTGGAIRGMNRIDMFWGAGPKARLMAGGMSARGQLILLLPKASVMRLQSRGLISSP